MLARKPTDSNGTALPKEWLSECQEIIDQAYKDQNEQKNSRIEIFGRLFEAEILIGFIIRQLGEHSEAPYSLLLSFDYDNPKQVIEIRKESLDIGSHFLDHYFIAQEKEYSPVWQKETIKKRSFYKNEIPLAR